MSMDLAARYHHVLARVSGRARLVAVSKAATIDDIRTLYDLGQRDFGENRADSLREKAAAMPDDVRWHFIGNIQSNKLRILRDLRPLVHSFDRPELLDRWGDVPVLVQVDFTGETRRNGIAPDALPETLQALAAHKVPALGLSTLPPREGDPRETFRALRALRDAHKLDELSMGMSDDYEIAIAEGATIVRVGSAIFTD